MSKKQKPAEEVEVNDEMVVAAATDINTVLAPNPLLDLEKPGEELQKEIEELFPNIMKGDALSKETWTTLTALGWKVAEPPKIERPKSSKTPSAPTKTSKAVKYSRLRSVIDVLKTVEKGMAISEQSLATKSDALYSKTTGKAANAKQALFTVTGWILPVLTAMDRVTKDGDKIMVMKSI